MRIAPREGLKIRDPHSRLHIPAAGIDVPDTDTYWTRRLADGDVVLVTEITQQPAEKAEEA
jgi:hypothetical protein